MRIPPEGYTVHEPDISALKGLKMGIIGFGNQARAWALNLYDSDLEVYAGLREGSPNTHDALWSMLEVLDPTRVARMCDVICLLIPDDTISSVLENLILPDVKPGTSIVLAHSYALFGKALDIRKDVDLILLAPHGPGHKVREGFISDAGLPAQWDIIQDATGVAEDRALALASGLGFAHGGLRRIGYREESVIDLFSEQAVLVGGLLAIMGTGLEILKEAGYDIPASRVSCIDEIEGTAALFSKYGLKGGLENVSSVAAYGAIQAAGKLRAPIKEVLIEILHQIETGEFSENFGQESESGYPILGEFRKHLDK